MKNKIKYVELYLRSLYPDNRFDVFILPETPSFHETIVVRSRARIKSLIHEANFLSEVFTALTGEFSLVLSVSDWFGAHAIDSGFRKAKGTISTQCRVLRKIAPPYMEVNIKKNRPRPIIEIFCHEKESIEGVLAYLDRRPDWAVELRTFKYVNLGGGGG